MFESVLKNMLKTYEKLPKLHQHWSHNRSNIDKKVMKIEIRNSIEKRMQKSVKFDASRPCWERFSLQSELVSQYFKVIKKMKTVTNIRLTLSQNPTKK